MKKSNCRGTQNCRNTKQTETRNTSVEYSKDLGTTQNKRNSTKSKTKTSRKK